jgi:hypothetical protein
LYEIDEEKQNGPVVIDTYGMFLYTEKNDKSDIFMRMPVFTAVGRVVILPPGKEAF